ncbi:MAG: hypothetical protein UX31_C0038G0006 [Candidatus Nomurabacteria bacterium GW2011_GWA1_46_11]|uniref:AB hydrolase-1 domain-containing protein n=1 Tax=Candidatus Nomurabacteria bacterium GW2011_GWA1_46_11 TaxID=1618732 RepID=A0A0G1QRV1_9BACT|nr:MAG: hypothetical protein UX31_C0038G0006 [Candidatus Nomurabacteria bacterium GW2011_GWA1_46_11]
MPTHQTHDNRTIPYEDTGTGHPLLFIPGWTMSRKSFRKQLSALAPSFRVITPDLRGQGDSEKRDVERIDLDVWIQDIHDLVMQLNLHQVVFVGWSLGALTMWTYCQRYGPERVAGLVHIDMLACLPRGWAAYKNKLIDENYRHYMSQFIGEMFMPTIRAKDQQFFLDEATKTPPILAKRLNTMMEELDIRDTMRQAKVPVLFAFGQHSRFFTHTEQEKTAHLVPHATRVWFPNSCHCPFWEEPERFNAVLSDFAHLLAKIP